MAKTTLIIELEYPDDMLEHTIKVVTEGNPELYAEGAHPTASNEELAFNGWLSAMLGRIEALISDAKDPLLKPGEGFKVEAKNRVGARDFPIKVELTVCGGEAH